MCVMIRRMGNNPLPSAFASLQRDALPHIGGEPTNFDPLMRAGLKKTIVFGYISRNADSNHAVVKYATDKVCSVFANLVY